MPEPARTRTIPPAGQTSEEHLVCTLPQLGRIRLSCDGQGLCALQLLAGQEPDLENRQPLSARAAALLGEARRQLEEYLARQRTAFSLPLSLHGTPFQRAVWQALLAIPYGETRTYGDIARAIGRPGACRAVGNANHANRLPLVIPCHRVVASTGLGGYGLGTDLKTSLLRLEQPEQANPLDPLDQQDQA